MKITISLIVIYILSFLLIFAFIYNRNKKEPKEEKMNLFLVPIVAGLLALAPAAVIAFFLFALLGSINVVDMLFSLNISTNQLIILAISLLIYLFTFDSIIEKVVEYIVGENIFYSIITMLTRIIAFYIIGLIIDFSQINSFAISIGVALIIFVIEMLYYFRKKKEL